MRRPASLLPAPAARLAGFVALAGLGALEWRRMVEGLPAERALAWVAAGAAAAIGLLAAARSRHPLAIPAAAVAGAGLAAAASGLDLRLLAPARWAELVEGLARGAEALGGARLPYRGTDPWPGVTLEVAGAAIVSGAAFLAFSPRARRRAVPWGALTLLLVLAVVPVAAMSDRAPLAAGAALAVATACFLFLERLPVRPGAGAAVLAAAALALALPLGSAADRDEPWLDYRAWAERIGPADPVSFEWEHAYGPIDWPRDGRELFRAKASGPLYWKAETLRSFRADRWLPGPGGDADGAEPEADLARDPAGLPEWGVRAEVMLRRLKTRTLVGPGTILGVDRASRGVHAEWVPGGWVASRELGRGDSYTVQAHVPRPSAAELAEAGAGAYGRQSDELRLTLPLRGPGPPASRLPRPEGAPPRYADEVTVTFPAYGSRAAPQAHYALAGRRGDGRRALRHTPYRRTWALSRRLRADSRGPWDYVLRVGAFMRANGFRYTERPPRPDPGVPPLEAFLHDDRAGYCQQFSGAMAMLLRMGGLPARVAAGFSPGGYRRSRDEWVIRDVDAHSWVEVWLDGIGWVTVDPTPSATPARSQTAALALPDRGDEAESGGPVLGRSAPPARRPEGLTREPVAGPGAAGRPSEDPPWGPIAALTAAILAGAAALRRGRGRAGPGGDGQLAELERALRRSGRPVAPGTTLAELEGRLGGSDYVRALRAARYGAAATAPTPAQRAQLRRELGRGLGPAGRLRALWALPPQRGRITFGAPGRGGASPPPAPGPR